MISVFSGLCFTSYECAVLMRRFSNSKILLHQFVLKELSCLVTDTRNTKFEYCTVIIPSLLKIVNLDSAIYSSVIEKKTDWIAKSVDYYLRPAWTCWPWSALVVKTKAGAASRLKVKEVEVFTFIFLKTLLLLGRKGKIYRNLEDAFDKLYNISLKKSK